MVQLRDLTLLSQSFHLPHQDVRAYCYRMGLSDHRSTERSYSCYMYFQLVTFNIKTIMMISNDEYGANQKCVES